MAKIPFILDGRTFRDHVRENGATYTLWTDDEDDAAWALGHLGQYVSGEYAGRTGPIYIYSVTRPRNGRPSFTIIGPHA